MKNHMRCQYQHDSEQNTDLPLVGKQRSMLRLPLLAASLLIAAQSFLPFEVGSTSAQTQHWNMQARERSQNLHSRALNFLLQPQGSKKKGGGLDEAIALLTRATDEDPDDPIPYATLGLALDMKGLYQQALDNLAKAHKLNANATETVLSIALTQYLGHDYDKCLSALSALIAKDPKLAPVDATVGFANLRKGEFEKAGEAFRRLVTARPNSQIGHQGLALANYFKGDLQLAKEAARHSQLLKPYPPVVALLAEISALQGTPAETKTLADTYWKMQAAKDKQDRSMTSIGYLASHDFHWDPFLVDSYDNPSLVMARALTLPGEESKRRSLCSKGKLDAGLQSLSQAGGADTRDFYLARQLGLLKLAQGSYPEAAQQFNRALEVAPYSHIDLLHLARAYSMSGRAAEASLMVRRFRELHPQEKLSAVFEEIAKVEPPAAPPAAPPPPPPQQQPSGF